MNSIEIGQKLSIRLLNGEITVKNIRVVKNPILGEYETKIDYTWTTADGQQGEDSVLFQKFLKFAELR